MKIIYFDKNKGLAKIKITSLDDLWHLSKIIEPGDFVAGKIERKVKIGGIEEKARIGRKVFFAKIIVEKVKYEANILRLLGKIVEGSEELPIGASHTLDICVGSELKIEKKWRAYQITRLKEAEAASVAPRALLCVLDDEQANLGLLTQSGLQHIGSMQLRLVKKRLKEPQEKEKLGKLAAELIRLIEEKQPDALILASPLFWKDELLKLLKNKMPELAKNCYLENVSTGSARGLTELLSRGVAEQVLKQSRLQKEFKLVERLLAEIAKGGLAEYGFKHVKHAVESGAVKILLLTDKLIAEARERGTNKELEQLIDAVESARGEVYILDSRNEPGQRLDGLGGIGAILRFKL